MKRLFVTTSFLVVSFVFPPAYAEPPVFINIGPMRVPHTHFNGPMSREHDADLDIFSLANSIEHSFGTNGNKPRKKAKVLINLPGENPFMAWFEAFEVSKCCFAVTEDLVVTADPDADLEDFEFTWRGKGKKDQEVLIAVRNGNATGYITTANGMWRIYFNRATDRHIVRYIDETNYPNKGDDVVHNLGQSKAISPYAPLSCKAIRYSRPRRMPERST